MKSDKLFHSSILFYILLSSKKTLILRLEFFIEKEGLLILNRNPIDIYDLNTSNISDGIILYEKITTNCSFYFANFNV